MEKIPAGYRRFDILDFLTSEEDIAEYLEAAQEEDDPAFLRDAQNIAAQARRKLAADGDHSGT